VLCVVCCVDQSAAVKYCMCDVMNEEVSVVSGVIVHHTVHYITISLYHYITISLYHYITISLYHYITISLYHYITISLYHYITISLKLIREVNCMCVCNVTGVNFISEFFIFSVAVSVVVIEVSE
jgi:hypothetical protein